MNRHYSVLTMRSSRSSCRLLYGARNARSGRLVTMTSTCGAKKNGSRSYVICTAIQSSAGWSTSLTIGNGPASRILRRESRAPLRSSPFGLTGGGSTVEPSQVPKSGHGAPKLEEKKCEQEVDSAYRAGSSILSSRKPATPAKKTRAMRMPGSRLTSGTRSVAAT